MKRFLLTITVCTVMTSATYAATKCVKDLSNANYCEALSPTGPEFIVQCDGENISGIGLCSYAKSKEYESRANVPSSPGDNKYCYCKMQTPAISDWVYSNIVYDDDEKCLAGCSGWCNLLTQNDSKFRSAMFSAIKK